jgi:outer membrane receptor protein involved in Fe transport
MRAQKQLCTRDPTAVLGCLPDSAGTDALNVNAQFTNTVASMQGFAGIGLPAGLGLFDLTQPAPVAPGDVNPSSYRQINADFDPVWRTQEKYGILYGTQKINDWLTANLVAGYEDHSYFSQESYNNVGSTPLNQARLGTFTFDPAHPFANLGTAEGLLAAILNGAIIPNPNFNPAYAANFAPYFTAHPGELPISALTNLGATGKSFAYFSPNQTVYDQSDAYNKQYSAELRFSSNLQGPFNFLIAGYYLRTTGWGDYYVPGNVIDYPGIVLGSILGALKAPALCETTGCTLGPTYYHNWGRNLELESKAMFGEVYYDILPDELKLTLGARFTDDMKSDHTRISFVSGLIPIGTTNETAATAALAAQGQADFDPTNGTPPFDVFQIQTKHFDKWTGRALLTWTPKVDFTDQTMVYGSYSRGYKSGGFNPGVQSGITAGVFPSFQPEGLDAFEVGTKNTLLDGELQANLTAWYYNYEDFQVSAIIQNTSVNSNVPAHLWGQEGEFFYAPDEAWLFNLNYGYVHSEVGNVSLVDPRNPTAGRSDAVLIKDATATGGAGQNCVVYRLPGTVALTPADAGVPGFFAPPVAAGGETGLAAHGVPLANFGMCSAGVRPTEAQMEAAGFTYGDPKLGPIGSRDDSGGVGVNLHGNQMQYTPPWTLAFGVQYTQSLDNGYTLVPRVDVSWHDSAWFRIFEDPADRQHAYALLDGTITLNSPNQKWYVQAFIKNAANAHSATGGYLTSSTSALYTNVFLVDPRTFGVRLGATW